MKYKADVFCPLAPSAEVVYSCISPDTADPVKFLSLR